MRWESRRGRGAGPTRSFSRPAPASALLGPPPRRRPPEADIRRRRSSGDPPASLPVSMAGAGSSSACRLPLPFCSGSIRRGDSSQSGHCACAEVYSSPSLSPLRVQGLQKKKNMSNRKHSPLRRQVNEPIRIKRSLRGWDERGILPMSIRLPWLSDKRQKKKKKASRAKI